MLIVFMILTLIIYCVYNMLPANKAFEMAQADIKNNPNLNFEERVQYWERFYGLDGNIFQRYLRWLGLYPFTPAAEGQGYEFKGILQGNFGTSISYAQPVIEIVGAPMQNTIFLNIFAVILGLGITIPLGIFCAVKRGSKRDIGVQVMTIVGYSMPVFIVAILFIWLFAIKLDIFPVSGMSTPGSNFTGFRAFIDRVYYMLLPLIVMTFCSLGGMTRYVRAAMIDALSLDCIRTARAKGVKESVVIYSHAFRNALIPIVILVIGWFLSIFSGSIMIEQIFGINGIGKLYFTALGQNDFEVVIFLQLFYVFIALIGNLIVDISYGFIDPRVRVSK